MAKREIVLTKDQEQEIIKRYQAFVEGMESPPKGRRKMIAAEMELPYRATSIFLESESPFVFCLFRVFRVFRG